ncbi:MAG TPA: ABC transporter permease [Acidimicrobiales bacterium]|nr:ABC transporter permease [Acidimicrobiales bacterium]
MSAVVTRLRGLLAAPPGEVEQSRAAAVGQLVLLYVLAIIVALLVTGALVEIVGGSLASVFSAIYTGSIGTFGAVGQTLDSAVPVLIVALGSLITVRAGMFNIGQTGQLLMGASVATLVALHLHGPGPLVLLATLAASVAGGAIWAGIGALLRLWRNIDVVISTLLLNYVAIQALGYAVSTQSILQEPTPPGGQAGGLPQSALIPASVRLPHPGQYPNFGVGLGLPIAVALVALFAVLLSRSPWGLRLRMVGANPVASRRFGVRVGLIAAGALILSGALAGFAGGVLLTGSVYRIQPGFDNNFGNDGLLCALVVRDQPWALLPVSFFFGMIRTGGSFLLSTGVPFYLAQVLEGLLVLAAVFPPVYLERREWARRLRAARALVLKAAA